MEILLKRLDTLTVICSFTCEDFCLYSLVVKNPVLNKNWKTGRYVSLTVVSYHSSRLN